jgi:DNA-binding Lrp family transcriptional regulator
VRAFHLDLGFPMFAPATEKIRSRAAVLPPTGPVAEADRLLLRSLATGIAPIARPVAPIAAALGRSESNVIGDVARLLRSGIISRFGLVLAHRRLGFTANAMVVFDVAQAEVEAVAEGFTGFAFVTLCYERPRRGRAWPYNLFCMIHGRDRVLVENQVAQLAAAAGAGARRHAILFSSRCFRQRGALLAAA